MEAPQSEAELPYNPANTLVGIYLRETKTNSKRYIPTCSIKNDRIISVRFQGKPFNITVIQIYVPTTDAKEAEVDQFNEDPQDLLELIPKKDVLFIIREWNAKVGSQEIPGVTGKFGPGVQNARGMVWGGRWERGSGWGTCVHPWWMHVDVWQNQYNIVK